jgi:hypothetical protein
MPSVIGLLEERKRAAAQRVEVLRTEADRVLAALREAELDWERFVVSRETVVEVLAGPGGVAEADTLGSGDSGPSPSGAVPGSVVPAWCEGLVRGTVLQGTRLRARGGAGSGEGGGRAVEGEPAGAAGLAGRGALQCLQARGRRARRRVMSMVIDHRIIASEVSGRRSKSRARRRERISQPVGSAAR